MSRKKLCGKTPQHEHFYLRCNSALARSFNVIRYTLHTYIYILHYKIYEMCIAEVKVIFLFDLSLSSGLGCEEVLFYFV